MDYQELRNTIDADGPALALALAGDRNGCAARVAIVLPKTIVETHVSERTVFALFSDDPINAEQFMQALESVASGDANATPPRPANPILGRALKWMQPNNGGVDTGNPAVRDMLDQLVTAGAITQEMATTVKASAESPTIVTAEDIERAGY